MHSNTFVIFRPHYTQIKKRILGPYLEHELANAIEHTCGHLKSSDYHIINEVEFRAVEPEEYERAFCSNPCNFVFAFLSVNTSWTNPMFFNPTSQVFYNNIVHISRKKDLFIISFHLHCDPWLKGRLFYELLSYVAQGNCSLLEGEPFFIGQNGSKYTGVHAAHIGVLVDNISLN